MSSNSCHLIKYYIKKESSSDMLELAAPIHLDILVVTTTSFGLSNLTYAQRKYDGRNIFPTLKKRYYEDSIFLSNIKITTIFQSKDSSPTGTLDIDQLISNRYETKTW